MIWITSKRRLSIIFLNVIFAGVAILSMFWLWSGFQTVQLCVKFQCPPYFTSAHLPETFKLQPLYSPDRHSGYSLSNNHISKLFSGGLFRRNKNKDLFLIPPFFTYSADGLGLRKHRLNNGGNELATKANVLALGDSFTFGDEVDDLATWPAFLERGSGKTVHNAGASWFGSAQAVARGYGVSLTMHIDTVILSVLIDEDIKRDRWITHGRHGQYRRRPVVDRNGVLMHLPAYDSKAGLWGWWYGIIQAGVASMDSIMDYVLQRLLQIPASKHVLVLQYGSDQVYRDPSKEAQEERALWVKKAKAWNIPVVDTLTTLRKAKDTRGPLWIQRVFIPPHGNRHHNTSYGNEIIAQAILDSGVLD